MVATTRRVKRPRFANAQDWLDALGGIPPERILFEPLPGTATVKDVIRHVDGDDKRLVELVDGTLVEKAMGYSESLVANEIAFHIKLFLKTTRLGGQVSGADGTLELLERLVRIPDVAFVSLARLPGGQVPDEAVPALVPNLTVEVLSNGNTAAEMQRKLREYFEAGVELVWYIDLPSRSVRVYTAVDQMSTLGEADVLTGGDVLPGFEVKVSQLFAELPPPDAVTTKRKKKR